MNTLLKEPQFRFLNGENPRDVWGANTAVKAAGCVGKHGVKLRWMWGCVTPGNGRGGGDNEVQSWAEAEGKF